MSICVLAERYGVKGQTLRKQYKEKISDYRNWDQLEHAHDYLLYPENIGENLSLDETCLSNGDVYTILTNKAAKGRKGALVAMVRGVATDAVSGILRRLPHRKRLSVKTVTTDLSSAMMLTVRKVFPAAKLINDRFHVQQLMSEAVDRLRIRYRWKVLDAENQAIREHRQKKKEAKSKAERERIGKWEPERMENGETLPQIVSRSKHIILKHWSKWNEQQKTRAAILFDKFPKLLEGYSLSMKLTDIFNKKSGPDEARLNLARWYNEVEKQSDKVIITSDNPRFEEPQEIINDMLAGLTKEDMRKVISIADRKEAIRTACMLAQAKDVILVAGKGHENYQEIKGIKHHFDDKEVLRDIFANE